MVAERFTICERNTQDTGVNAAMKAPAAWASPKKPSLSAKAAGRGPACIGPDYRAALMRTTVLKSDIGYISYVTRALWDLRYVYSLC
ncbi:hypothetical protein GCM10009000_086800 [Halobacterium noricense]|uniref:Uncharacterized protein n=1 Tax=Haladaptatus pallidirubidus TaxID=1008152 RepID=A0AAV3US41_9EURY